MSSYIFLLICCLLQCWSVTPGDAAAACKGYAVYNLTFLGMWNKNDHPTDFPDGQAHFSPIIGVSHDSKYKMWGPGMKASEGIKTVAETGGTMPLYQEIKNMINKKYAYMAIQGPKMPLSSPGNLTGIQVKVNSHYHLVSIVTMIAPSPDWFVGIHNKDFCDSNSGMWMDSPSYNLQPWDSGTDDGTTFKSANVKTNPAVNIFQITKDTANTPFAGANPIPSLAMMKFKKVSEGMMTTQTPTTGGNKMAKTSKASGLTVTHVTLFLTLIGCLIA